MSKKKLKTESILNELKDGSVFFQKESSPPPQNSSEKRTDFRTEHRSNQLPIKRPTKRYSFEFYEDQIKYIKRLKIKTELAGKNISLSDIVRTALDYYFESVRKNERSDLRPVKPLKEQS